jgi:hypothetical protein
MGPVITAQGRAANAGEKKADAIGKEADRKY